MLFMKFLEKVYTNALETYFKLSERGHTVVYYGNRARGFSKEQAARSEKWFQSLAREYGERGKRLYKLKFEEVQGMTNRDLCAFAAQGK
jgi:hypothetical protein